MRAAKLVFRTNRKQTLCNVFWFKPHSLPLSCISRLLVQRRPSSSTAATTTTTQSIFVIIYLFRTTSAVQRRSEDKLPVRRWNTVGVHLDVPAKPPERIRSPDVLLPIYQLVRPACKPFYSPTIRETLRSSSTWAAPLSAIDTTNFTAKAPFDYANVKFFHTFCL